MSHSYQSPAKPPTDSGRKPLCSGKHEDSNKKTERKPGAPQEFFRQDSRGHGLDSQPQMQYSMQKASTSSQDNQSSEIFKAKYSDINNLMSEVAKLSEDGRKRSDLTTFYKKKESNPSEENDLIKQGIFQSYG